jgi:hypothetical protein
VLNPRDKAPEFVGRDRSGKTMPYPALRQVDEDVYA